jgi:hypothetical protein
MSSSDINRELDRTDQLSSRITTEMISAGRGYELPTETIKKSDPLSVRMKNLFVRRQALRYEVERRYGPGAPNRLPRGFGPIRALNARRTNRRPVKRAAPRRRRHRGKVVTTVSRSKVIRRTTNRRALVVLYASKPRHTRLKYLGHGKFGAKGRPVMFQSAAEANAVGRALVEAFPAILRGWTVRADTDPRAPAPARRFQAEPMGPAEALYRDQVRRDTEAAHRWLARQKK